MSDTRDAEEFDCLIIGGGQGASLATQLARGGLKTVVIERADFGGTCVNRGCTPTKTLIASARVANYARTAHKWGVHAGEVRVDMAEVTGRKSEVVRDFRGDVEKGLEIPNLTVVRGEASFSAPRTVQVLADGQMRVLKAQSVVIATGGESAQPKIEGLDSVGWLDSTSILDLRHVPEHLLIMGGGTIAVEFAQAFRRLGSRVSIIEKNKALLSKEDADVSLAVREILEEDGIQILCGSQVEKVERQGESIVLQVLVGGPDGEERTLSGSHLLVATGRRPSTGHLNLEAAGVRCDDKGFVQVDEFLSTSAEGVFALGDVAKSPPFTHIAFDDGRILAERILHGRKRSTQARALTWTVFIDPQLGRVGLSEAEARDKGLRFEVARIEMKDVARPLEVGEARGFWKVLVEQESGQILGGSFLSLEGGEMAALCLVAMLGQVPYHKLRDLPISHPTLAESFNNLFLKLDRERAAMERAQVLAE